MVQKLHKLVLLLGFIALTGCENSNEEIGTPMCIEEKITAIKNQPVANPPIEVWKWEVDEKTFYYLTSDCCDQFNFLYNSDCEVICAPDGGFTGNGDGNCLQFSTDVQKTLIWKDSRK